MDMGQNKSLSDEILDLERGEQIEEELSKLKQRISKRSKKEASSQKDD